MKSYLPKFIIMLLLLFSLILTNCESSSDSNTPPSVIISECNPAADSTVDTSGYSYFIIQFDMEMDTSSLTVTTIKLQGNTVGNVLIDTVIYSPSDHKVIVDPHDFSGYFTFRNGETYTVTVTKYVKNIDGVSLAEDVSYSFLSQW